MWSGRGVGVGVGGGGRVKLYLDEKRRTVNKK